eukprot:TRINITY_DN58828_c0_g1_i1.p1 TRINITY_DN58828_c0_g1~~TRINITY_DN58828_c0_g1_i1.p1  ORF type:complete len:367 (-),score=39.74 TRINITY_DN58828_c0_g1_i1:8-979(-)
MSATLGSLGWWSYDSVVFFTCSGYTLGQWRSVLTSHGSLGERLFYLHSFNANTSSASAGRLFASELFDATAFVPEHLSADRPASEDTTWVRHIKGFGVSHGIPRHPTAGTSLPLADIVELCPAQDWTLHPVASKLEASECPNAKLLLNSCVADEEAVVEEATPLGWAATRCCWPSMLVAATQVSPCQGHWVYRNRTWGKQLQAASCLPQFSTYYDSYRSCKALGLTLCSQEHVQSCCNTGCTLNPRVWIRSPETEGCLAQAATAASQPWSSVESLPHVRQSSTPADAELRKREQVFLSFSEEAHSTKVEWLASSTLQHGRWQS